MTLLWIRNPWCNRLLFLVLGATLATAAHASVRWWENAETAGNVEGTWAVQGPFGDPEVAANVCEFRPDGTFWTRATRADGGLKYVSHGRWWVSGRYLYKDYAMTLDGKPMQAGGHPARLHLLRADAEGMILAGGEGSPVRFRRQPVQGA
jgi:hypothetical protein